MIKDLKITFKGPFFNGTALKMVERAMEKAMERTCVEVEQAVIDDYTAKRKESDNKRSLIIESVHYNIPLISATKVVGVVFAGGNIAPYAVFVNDGRGYKNGNTFPGYHFMEAGALKRNEVAERNLREELSKL